MERFYTIGPRVDATRRQIHVLNLKPWDEGFEYTRHPFNKSTLMDVAHIFMRNAALLLRHGRRAKYGILCFQSHGGSIALENRLIPAPAGEELAQKH